jgi:hypothetical protein
LEQVRQTGEGVYFINVRYFLTVYLQFDGINLPLMEVNEVGVDDHGNGIRHTAIGAFCPWNFGGFLSG